MSNYAAKANAGVTDFLKEAARRARGDVLASICCPLITRRAAPTEHIRRTSLFLESYIIPKMLMNEINIGKNVKKAKTKNPPYVANPNAMGGTRMKGETSDYGVLQVRFSHD